MIEIPLTQGLVALVDDEDYALVSQHRWMAARRRNGIYAVRHEKRPEGRRQVGIHRDIMGAPDGVLVDHVNGDGLDNRRANLRFATISQNNHNRHSTWGTSVFRGVGWHSKTQKWAAFAGERGRVHHLGVFVSEVDAALAYDDFARAVWGDYASPNMPTEPTGHWRVMGPRPAQSTCSGCGAPAACWSAPPLCALCGGFEQAKNRGNPVRHSVAAARLRLGWTQGELARRAGLSKALVAFIETHRRRLSSRSAALLSCALGVAEATLFEEAA